MAPRKDGMRYESLAARHVAEGERLVMRQRAIIRELRQGGQPTELAEDVLRTLETTLGLAKRHRERLRAAEPATPLPFAVAVTLPPLDADAYISRMRQWLRLNAPDLQWAADREEGGARLRVYFDDGSVAARFAEAWNGVTRTATADTRDRG
jgi:hypothetical protein